MEYDIPREPINGEALTVDWGRRVIRALRSMRIIPRGPVETSVTSQGTFVSVRGSRPQEQRARADRGCFRLLTATRESESGGEPETVTTFGNRYFQAGGKVYAFNPEYPSSLCPAVEDFVMRGELTDPPQKTDETGEPYTNLDKPFVAFKHPAVYPAMEADGVTRMYPQIVAYETFEEMVRAQYDLNWIVKPLYKFSHYGDVLVDFRTVLDFGQYEPPDDVDSRDFSQSDDEDKPGGS